MTMILITQNLASSTLMGVLILNYSIELFSSSNNLTSQIYWTTEETILVTLNNPCINYLLQILAWNNVGKGNVTTSLLILYHYVLKNIGVVLYTVL